MVVEHSLIYGSPATVAEKLAEVEAIGVGGVIMQFRLGPMAYRGRGAEPDAVHAEGSAGVAMAHAAWLHSAQT